MCVLVCVFFLEGEGEGGVRLLGKSACGTGCQHVEPVSVKELLCIGFWTFLGVFLSPYYSTRHVDKNRLIETNGLRIND